jgi:hypothetical protein
MASRFVITASAAKKRFLVSAQVVGNVITTDSVVHLGPVKKRYA